MPGEVVAQGLDRAETGCADDAFDGRTAPGFRDVRLHRALLPDARFQLVNVAHWDSAEACAAAGSNPAVTASVDEARKIATAHPAIYRVAAEVS